MNNQLKKSMTKNWFRLMQETICQDIEEIENKKKYLDQKIGKEVIIVMRVVEKSDYLKTEKYSKK